MQNFEDFFNAPCPVLADGRTWRDYFILIMVAFNSKMEMRQHDESVKELVHALARINPKIKENSCVNWEEQEYTIKELMHYIFYKDTFSVKLKSLNNSDN